MFTRHISPTKLIIYATPRTGSTLLGTLLDAHPEISYKDEILAKSRWSGIPKRFLRRIVIKRITPWLQLASLRTPGIYACKLMQHQAKLDSSSLKRLTYSGWRIVTLRRSDLVAQVLSMEVAWRYRRWHRYQGQDEIECQAFEIPGQYFIDRLNFWNSIRVSTQRVLEGVPHHSVVYEEDLQRSERWQDTSAKIFNFLGIKEVPVSSNLVKFTERPYQDFILNYCELVESGREFMTTKGDQYPH